MTVNILKRVIFLALVLTTGWEGYSFLTANVEASSNSQPSIFSVSMVDVFEHSRRAGSVDFEVFVRDSVTGQSVAATVTAISTDGSTAGLETDAAGRGSSRLASGRNEFEITAVGYHSLKTYFVLQDSLDVTVWLDPETVPLQMRTDVVESKLRPGLTLIHGNIYDGSTGNPVPGAHVYVEGTEPRAYTGQTGYFNLSVPTSPVDENGSLPGSRVIVVELNGKVVHRRLNTMISEGAVHFIIDLERGAVDKDGTHKLRLSPEELRNTQAAPANPLTEFDLSPASEIQSAQPGGITVPSSIRVGSSCPAGRTSCTVFTVYSLDTYVRFGLDDEWIASWNANSLKAGAIAFRSYGVYHIFFPINVANYDICNTTSCQVMDPNDSATSTNNATIQTTGSIVINAAGTGPFFAEYSAENNLGGCPDGFTGNNTSWPCLSDAVDAGQTFFGHGRGMCQWGSQRWSINQGKDFVWIVNHYYNANGSPSGLRNGSLQMGPNTLLPPPTLIAPGVTTAPGQTISTVTPTFVWESLAGADGYSLYISKFNGTTYDVVFNSETAVGQPLIDNNYNLPAGILQVGSQYRWNMSSHIGAGYGAANTFRNYFVVSASVSISGKVTTPSGLAQRNAVVTLVDSQNVRLTATTSSFGLYAFEGITPGQTYTMTVASKRYRYTPVTLQINGNLSNVDFMGLE